MSDFRVLPGGKLPIRVFDPRADVFKYGRELPHWSQAGTLCFLTWRTDDSIPQPVLNRWLKERWTWLNAHGIDPFNCEWRSQFELLDAELRREFCQSFSDRWHDLLDAGHGACVLGRPDLSKIVADSLHYFDEERYVLTDFIVMPNHVHVLCAFANEDRMLEQCESWKHFTATRINRLLHQNGRFWQQDGFDHLVRSVEEFEEKRHYIGVNPKKARLAPGEFVHFSKPL